MAPDNKPKPTSEDQKLQAIDGIRKWEEDAATDQAEKQATDTLFKQKIAQIEELAKAEAKEFAKEEAKSFVTHGFDEGGAYKFGDSYKSSKYGALTNRLGKLILPRKRPILGSLIGLIIFGIVSWGFFTVTQGPMQFVHFAKYLQETHFYVNHYFLNNRLGKAIIYANNADATERRNLSFIGNQLADHYETRLKNAGITPEYDNTRRIRALTIDPNTTEGRKAMLQLEKAGIDVNELRNGNEPFRVDIDRNDLGDTSTRFRRQLISGMVGTLDMNGVSAASASRLLKLRAGVDFHPLKNLVRTADEDTNTFTKRVMDAFESRVKRGIDYNGKPVANIDPGTEENPADDQTTKTSEEFSDHVTDIEDSSSNAARSTAIRTKLTTGYGLTGFAAMVCAAQQIGNAAANLSYMNVNLPLIRAGTATVSMGSQVQSGIDTNMDEIGVMQEKLYDEDSKTYWGDARSIQANMGLEPTGEDIPDAARPTTGDKPSFFYTIDDIIAGIPGGSGFCGVVTTTFGGWALTAVGIGLTATGPVGAALQLGAEFATETLAASFLDDIIAWIARDPVDIDVAGQVWGSYIDYGSLLAANDSSISYGGAELTNEQYGELVAEKNAVQAMQREQQSFFARYFDPDNYHSVVSTFAMQYIYPTDTSSVASLVTAPASIFSKLSTNVSSLFTNQAKADEALVYDYGIPRFGFTQSEIDDPKLDDPYKNEEVVMGYDIAALNEEFGYACFNTIINPDTFKLQTISRDKDEDGKPLPATKRYDQIDEKCKDRSNERLVRYRMYIADTVAILSAACYEDVEIEDRDPCSEIGVTTPAQVSLTPAVEPEVGPGVVVPSGGWTKPMTSYRISSRYGPRFIFGYSFHYGTDLAAPNGTPYMAAKDGIVTEVKVESWGTNYIYIDHGNGISTQYGHSYMNNINVKVGDRVTAGQIIALVGDQGNVTGPHLHFNVKVDGRFVDPEIFMREQGVPL